MSESKLTNPKDSVGIKKWRNFTTIPLTVMAEVGVAFLEGARKYGRHNYRSAGVRSSVYVDAAMGHVMQWWEGEDKDPDSGLSHIVKAIASLVVLRDAMIQDKLNDDRPPRGNLDQVRTDLQSVVDRMFAKYPESVPAFTEENTKENYNNAFGTTPSGEDIKDFLDAAFGTTPSGEVVQYNINPEYDHPLIEIHRSQL